MYFLGSLHPPMKLLPSVPLIRFCRHIPHWSGRQCSRWNRYSRQDSWPAKVPYLDPVLIIPIHRWHDHPNYSSRTRTSPRPSSFNPSNVRYCFMLKTSRGIVPRLQSLLPLNPRRTKNHCFILPTTCQICWLYQIPDVTTFLRNELVPPHEIKRKECSKFWLVFCPQNGACVVMHTTRSRDYTRRVPTEGGVGILATTGLLSFLMPLLFFSTFL